MRSKQGMVEITALFPSPASGNTQRFTTSGLRETGVSVSTSVDTSSFPGGSGTSLTGPEQTPTCSSRTTRKRFTKRRQLPTPGEGPEITVCWQGCLQPPPETAQPTSKLDPVTSKAASFTTPRYTTSDPKEVCTILGR